MCFWSNNQIYTTQAIAESNSHSARRVISFAVERIGGLVWLRSGNKAKNRLLYENNNKNNERTHIKTQARPIHGGETESRPQKDTY